MQLLNAENFFGSAGKLPFRETIRQSLFAIRCRSTSRQSPVANRCHFRLGRSLALPFHSRHPSRVPRPVLSRRSGFSRHQLRTEVRSMEFHGLLTPCIHATGFSQWLMTKFLSAEFIRRLRVFDFRVVLPHDRNFGRQRRSAALQKNHSLLTIRCRFPSPVPSAP